MIKNGKILEEFEKSQIKKPVNRKQNFLIINALYKEALHLGIFPLKNPLDGIEIIIKIAKVINSV